MRTPLSAPLVVAIVAVALVVGSARAAPRATDATASSGSASEQAASVASTTPTPPKGRFGGQIRLLGEPIPVPDYVFQERLAGGERVDRAMLEFRGRVVVLNFWATWCGVCAKEMPKLDRLAGRLAATGVDVVALSIDDDIDRAGQALAKRGHTNLRVFHDSQAVLSALLGIRGVPTTFVVGPGGRAVAVVQGPADWGSKEAEIWLRSLAPGGDGTPAAIEARALRLPTGHVVLDDGAAKEVGTRTGE